MVELIVGGAVAAFIAMVAGVYHMQASHAAERNRALREIRELAYSHAQLLATLAEKQRDERTTLAEESARSMRAMYATFVQHALRAATVAKASSAAEGAIAAGQLAQMDVAGDANFQAKMAEIQEKMAQHTPWQKTTEPQIPNTPKIIQDAETGDVLVRM